MRTEAAHSEQDTTVRVLFVAFELSWKNWRLGFSTGLGQKAREKSIPARDLARLAEEIETAKRRFKLSEKCRVVSCYEAGRDGFWLHRFLTSAGIDNRVVDSSSIEVNRRAKHVKTDSLDVAKLLAMLIRYEGGEKRVWSVVRVPSVREEDERQGHRELTKLKADRAREVNRIKGLLAGQGIALEKRGKADVDPGNLTLWDGSPLPEGLRERIRRGRERIAQLDGQIAEIEGKRLDELMTSPHPDARKARALMNLKGIGPQTAWVCVKEFFGWRDFKNRRQIGALAGLTPTPYQSGASAREQGISKAGNRHIRARAIETAWFWLRYQPTSALSLWYFERFADGGARRRRIGIVALARKLLIALWRYLETGELPVGAAVKA